MAKEFAVEAHGKQKYGDKPYIVHLEAVVQNLLNYSEDAKVIGYLHDVIEDTDVSYKKINDVFGPFVADCIAIITDEPGLNRKDKKLKTFDKMSKVSGELELALTVKAADRLANIEACITQGNSKLLGMYIKEHPMFYTAVYREYRCENIWLKIKVAIGV